LDRPDLFITDSFVGGKTVAAQSGATFDVLGLQRKSSPDPGTNKPWAKVADSGAADVDAAVQTAHEAFQSYRNISNRTRGQWILRWDALMREHKKDLATLLVYETGKPMYEAIGEMDYSLTFTAWFSSEAERIQGTCFVPSAPNRRVFTMKQPLGVAVALVPWNFPIAMVLRKAAAALAAGCTMVVKPSPETPITAMAVARLATEAGFPPGVLNVLPTSLSNTPSLSEALCTHPLVKKVTFTGSTRVGQLVANHCSTGLKKVVLELGGNCPCVIFDDADVEAALRELVGLKWRHAGQACVTVNRFIVQSGVYDRFVRRFTEESAKLVVGHGAAEGTTLGPVTKPESLDRADRLVADAVAKGAHVVAGGGRIRDKGDGYFFQPTILTDMSHESRMSCEECFAPIAAFYRFETEDEAVKAANDTPMGLASYAFTKDVDRIWRLYENLEAGMIGLNSGNSSAAESPFGGIKYSGYGKEAGKDVAVSEYMITKTGTLTVNGVV
ncbi:Acyl-CoA reductase or other NAD-dependent aldehyde dehydrogenase, partial [Geosmithia morbida]